jgi:SAM-dependent methyltransferase
MSDQRDFFRDEERDYWAAAEGLKDEEVGLIEGWLDPASATLDAGTGGGRIARALVARDYGNVTGFDFTPELIAAARAADAHGAIAFDVADATELPYTDASFGQALYLQQVISTIDDPEGREAALREAVRVLRPGGVALFSFVCLESRLSSLAQRGYVSYLRAVRRLRRDQRPLQSMPRLRRRGRFGPAALRDAGPFNWWYRAAEAENALRGAGFEPLGLAFGIDAAAGRLRPSAASALAAGAAGTLYVVVRKPG